MKKKLNDLTVDEFSTLKRMGFLHEMYPDAPDTWEGLLKHKGDKKYYDAVKIFKKILASSDRYDIINLKQLANRWLNEYKE